MVDFLMKINGATNAMMQTGDKTTLNKDMLWVNELRNKFEN